VSKAYRLAKNGHRRVWPLNSHLKTNMTPEQYLYSNVPILWNILFKTESVKRTKFKFKSGINIGEDMCMLFYMFPKFHSIGICKKKTYYFVQYDNSLTDSKNSKYRNISPTIRQLEYFLGLKKELSASLINEYIFCSFSYIYSMLYVLRYWYRWKAPRKEFIRKTFKDLYKIFDKFNVKLKPPRSWKRRIFWHVFCKCKIDKRYR
jgi:hypothetical protein